MLIVYMITQAEIEEIAANIQLTLDNPQSVRKQLQKLNLVQQRLMILKKELRQSLQELNSNSQDHQHLANNLINTGLPFLPPSLRKWQPAARSGAREIIRNRNKAKREPYLEIDALITEYLSEIAKLKLEAQEYLFNQS